MSIEDEIRKSPILGKTIPDPLIPTEEKPPPYLPPRPKMTREEYLRMRDTGEINIGKE